MKKVGVAGLGTMGLAIASNLIKKGYDVYGYDCNAVRMALLEEKGGHGTSDAAALGKETDTVIAMVFSPDNLRELLFGNRGLAETLSSGGTLMITASMGPDVVQEVESKLAKQGVAILDTPVMADFHDAENGQMHMLIAGEPSVVAKNRELLKDMSLELYKMGDRAGMAQAGKMCLQDLFCLTFESGFETITLARRYQLNIEEIRRLFRDSPAASDMLHMAIDFGLKREFKGTYSPMTILNKDVHMAVAMAEKNALLMPASCATAKVFQTAIECWPDEDVWSGIKIIEGDQEDRT